MKKPKRKSKDGCSGCQDYRLGVSAGNDEILIRVRETIDALDKLFVEAVRKREVLMKQADDDLDYNYARGKVAATKNCLFHMRREFDRMFKTFGQSSKPEGLDNIAWAKEGGGK